MTTHRYSIIYSLALTGNISIYNLNLLVGKNSGVLVLLILGRFFEIINLPCVIHYFEYLVSLCENSEMNPPTLEPKQVLHQFAPEAFLQLN